MGTATCAERRGGSPAAPATRRPRWSPDGSRLAFLRAQDGAPQVWLLPADGGEPEQVTDLPLGAGAPVWSPDGSRIAFTAAVDPAPRGTGPIVTHRLDYQADGAGMFGAVRNQLHVLDLGHRRVPPADRRAASTPASPRGRPTAARWRSPAASARTAT